jgi:hypothetical protein
MPIVHNSQTVVNNANLQGTIPGAFSVPRHRSITGLILDMSNGHRNPVLNNLHHGHIVYREQAANYRHAQILAQLAEQQREREIQEIQLHLQRKQEQARAEAEQAWQQHIQLLQEEEQRQIQLLEEHEHQQQQQELEQEHRCLAHLEQNEE